jgi:ribosome recycling factor
MENLKEVESRMQGAIDALTREFAGVRTGRATQALLEGVRVDNYGTLTPVPQVATVSVPDSKSLIVQPWDATLLPAIEKAIMKSDLGLTPANDGKIIRLTLPSLTEERRKQLAKVVRQLAETARVAVRNVRHEAINKTRAMEKEKKISEDQAKRDQVEVQKTTDRLIQRVDELLKKKEQEILEF